MIIYDLDIVGVAIDPSETNSPLTIDPNTVLPRAVPFEQFESVARKRLQVAQLRSRRKQFQFSSGGSFKRVESSGEDVICQGLRVTASKASNH
jgi:hypothetical protein